jgi:hypothetical protein
MRRKYVMQLVLAASVAALVPLGAAQAAEPLQSAEVQALIGKNGFEFRGHQTMWKFAPDGKVTADDNQYRAGQGAMGETWGMKSAGTWRVDGQKLCIKWQGQANDHCYTVTRGTGRMVVLSGPRTIQGTIDANEQPGYAETPGAPAPAVPQGYHYNYRYQRVPGAR